MPHGARSTISRRAIARPTSTRPCILARSALKQLPHVDKRVALLSDLAGAPLPKGEPALWVPLEKLTAAAEDCGVVAAEQRGRRVTVQVACNTSPAARGRSVELFASKDQLGAGKPRRRAG